MNGEDKSQLELLRLEIKGEFNLVQQKLDAVIKIQEDHEARIRVTERWKLSLPISIVLVIATIVGGAIGLGK